MIEFIRSGNDFQEAKKRFEEIFEKSIALPQMVFNKDFQIFYGFEFDAIYTEPFFNGLQSFLKKLNEKQFTFYTIEPSPKDYFFKHFSKYNAFNVCENEDHKSYLHFIHSDPGNSPADSIKDNSRLVAIYSYFNDWGIIASDDWEIAIVAFKDLKTWNTFITSFNEGVYFSAPENRFEVIDRKLTLKKKAKDFYSNLIQNYR